MSRLFGIKYLSPQELCTETVIKYFQANVVCNRKMYLQGCALLVGVWFLCFGLVLISWLLLLLHILS